MYTVFFWLRLCVHCITAVLPVSQPDIVNIEWKLERRGWDTNDDGEIAADEDLAQVCERDDTYVFAANGIATCYDNEVRCNGPEEKKMRWNDSPGFSDSLPLLAVGLKSLPGGKLRVVLAGTDDQHFLLILKK